MEASTLTASTASSTMFSTSTEAVLTRVLYYSTSEENSICMGLIGERDHKKFCCSTNCGVGKHEISKFQSKAGLFIRVPKKVDQAFTNPFLPDQYLEAPLLELFLESEKTVEEWSANFSQILAAGTKFSADAWTALQIVRNKAKANRTPRKTATIKNELYDKLFSLVRDLEDVRGSVEASQDEEIDEVEIRIATLEFQIKLIAKRFEEWVSAQHLEMREIQDNVEATNSRLIDSESMIGEYPPNLQGKLEPTLWATIAEILSKSDLSDPFHSPTWLKTIKDFRNLESTVLTEKRIYDDFKLALVKLCGQFKSDIEHLDRKIKITDTQVANYMVSSPTSLFGSVQDPPLAEVEMLNKNYEDVLGKLEQLNQSVKSFASAPADGTPGGVEIGDLKFSNRPDLRVWVDENLKKFNFPFGVFLDIYSFLARVQTGYTSEDPAQSMLKNLDLNHRVHLTSDEATTLSSFMYMVPPILGKAGGGNTALASTKLTFLPALREKEDWENKTRNGGVRYVIEDQMPNVIFQMKDLISTRLYGNSQAIMLATTCLSISQTFLVELIRFVSDTYRDLDLAGFPEKSSWLLVTKLVVRIFGTDLDKVRSYMRGKMDTSDHGQLATDALWGTLRTIGVMQDYLRHGIENHPAISAEYVRFLVTNSPLGMVSKFDLQLKSLNEKLEEVSAQAKAAQSSAGTAMNKALEAKKAADKKP